MQAAVIGDAGARESGSLVEVGEAGGGLGGGGARQVVLMVGGEGREVLAALNRRFGFDFGAEAGVACPGVSLEHLDAQVAVLDGSGDHSAGAASDVPGQVVDGVEN